MQANSSVMDAGSQRDARPLPPRFAHMRVDGRTRFARMALHCLQALHSDLLAGVTTLTDTDGSTSSEPP
jgi:hypothetical protein